MKQLGECGGVKVFLSPKQYEEYKGNLNKQIEELQQRIDKAIEYIENYNIEGIPFYSVIKEDLLNILQGSDKE